MRTGKFSSKFTSKRKWPGSEGSRMILPTFLLTLDVYSYLEGGKGCTGDSLSSMDTIIFTFTSERVQLQVVITAPDRQLLTYCL